MELAYCLSAGLRRYGWLLVAALLHLATTLMGGAIGGPQKGGNRGRAIGGPQQAVPQTRTGDGGWRRPREDLQALLSLIIGGALVRDGGAHGTAQHKTVGCTVILAADHLSVPNWHPAQWGVLYDGRGGHPRLRPA
jgi:hypothetical protein